MSVLEVTIKGFLLGQTVENVVHFVNDGPDEPDLSLVANTIATTWLDQIRDIVPNETTFTQITVRNRNQPGLAPYVLAINLQGRSSTIESMPPFVCFLAKFQTATAGRTGRGRMYLSSPNHGHVSQGRLNPTVYAFVSGKLNNLLAAFGPNGSTYLQLVVTSRTNFNAIKPVINITLDPIPRVQRRRNIGVGV
jgi:hypothetical protein